MRHFTGRRWTGRELHLRTPAAAIKAATTPATTKVTTVRLAEDQDPPDPPQQHPEVTKMADAAVGTRFGYIGDLD